jgi:outer membrane receptor protein involved in Fe transport
MVLAAVPVSAQDAGSRESQNASPSGVDQLDEIVVTGQAKTYAVTAVSQEMIRRQPPLASVNEVLNELPGVHVTEADYFGSADFHTAITMRGFNSGMGAQQIGTTIDGLPNGGSAYGGGSRANRFLDIEDLRTVEVSQGTADISSRSNEALGGTLNFISTDPRPDSRVRLGVAVGDQSARRYYARVDTGEFLPDTFAFFSASATRHNDWVDDATPTTRDHATAKLVTKKAGFDLTAFASWDDVNEAEYSSVSFASFQANPRRDNLLPGWTGIPHFDQSARDVSRAHRENLFTYVKAERSAGSITGQVSAYYHRMRGQGDFAPPYIVNLVADAAGLPESELFGQTPRLGGASLTQDRGYASTSFIFFVDDQGRFLQPRTGCVGRQGVPAASDPLCYDGAARPVSSYRHTHYENDRYGLTADVEIDQRFGRVENTVRGGLWIERYDSASTRDWHRIVNPLLNDTYEAAPYWIQFVNDRTVNETMYYLEDVARIGRWTFRAGVKQFFVKNERRQPVGDGLTTIQDADSEPQWNFGAAWAAARGVELFAGWSRNFNAINVGRLSGDPKETAELKPETARNIEVGARINRGPLQAAVTLYDIEFQNRITFIPLGIGNDDIYLSERDGTYVNLGGIQSRGVEALASYSFDSGWKLSGSYTFNDATYLSTGSPDLDLTAGIRAGAQVFGSPRTMAVLAADYDGGFWRVGASAKHVGDRFIDFGGKQTAPAYTLVNANLSLSLEGLAPQLGNIEASVTVNNLTDIELSMDHLCRAPAVGGNRLADLSGHGR